MARDEFLLPRAIARQQGITLQVVDYNVLEEQSVADSTGATSVAYDPVEPGYLWRVERIVVSTTGSKQLAVDVYGGDATPINLRDGTPLFPGFIAVGEYDPPLTVLSGRQLTVTTSGGTVGDQVTVSTQYQLVSKAPA